jgi:hypothetical protein
LHQNLLLQKYNQILKYFQQNKLAYNLFLLVGLC